MWTLPKFDQSSGRLPLAWGMVAIAALAHPAAVHAQSAQTVELDRNGAVKAIPFERTQSTVYTYTQFDGQFHGQFGHDDDPVVVDPVNYPPNYPVNYRGHDSGDDSGHHRDYHRRDRQNFILISPAAVNTPRDHYPLINPPMVRPHSFPPPIGRYNYPVRYPITVPNWYTPRLHRDRSFNR